MYGWARSSARRSRRSACVHSLKRLVQDSIHEGFVQRGVAHQEPEEQRAVEQVEGDLDIEVAAHFPALHPPLEQGLALGAPGEDEVVAERLRQFGLSLGSSNH